MPREERRKIFISLCGGDEIFLKRAHLYTEYSTIHRCRFQVEEAIQIF